MGRKIVNRVQNFTRYFFIIWVMTGIFFSGGEGIQLLPFPVSPQKIENYSPLLKITKNKAYSLSIHNSAAQSVSVKNRIKKNIDSVIGPALFRDKLQQTQKPSLLRQQNYQTATFQTPNFLSSAPSRAPPII